MSVPRTAYRLELVPIPGVLPPEVRLKAALKRLLRSYGLRCASVVELPAGMARARILHAAAGRSDAGPRAGAATAAAVCAACEMGFERRRPWARFCSASCRSRARAKRPIAERR